MSQLAAVFEILSVPRFAEDEAETRVYDSLVGQHAFWNCLIEQVVQQYHATVELRLASIGLNEKVRVSLRIHAIAGSSDADLERLQITLAQVADLLPPDYDWRLQNEDSAAAEPDMPMARLVRRMNYISLPAVLGRMHVQESRRTAQPVGEEPVLRRLPLLTTDIREAELIQFCVGVPATLERFKPRRIVLYTALQRAGRAVVSLCLHPVAGTDIRGARVTALHWKRFLESFLRDFQTSSSAEVQGMQEAYTPFHFPDQKLVYVTLRVASEHTASTLQLANVVAATMGGARAYVIQEPSQLSPASALTDPHLDIPDKGWTAEHENDARFEVRQALEQSDVAIPEDQDGEPLMDYLLHAPHLMLVEQAEELLQLPIAQEEGLPGIDSRLQPPFAVPNLRFTPVLDFEGNIAVPHPEQLRLGMVRRASIASDNSQSSLRHAYWHNIRPVDMTKHALVVGSTGSGKTLTTLFLVRELARLRVKFLVIEPVKTEYFDQLRKVVPDVQRVRLERREGAPVGHDFLIFDPLRIPKGTSVAKHASYVKSCFEAAFPLDAVSSLLLETGLLRYYMGRTSQGCGFDKFHVGEGKPEIRNDKIYPSFATFREYFLESFLKDEFAGSSAVSAQRAVDVYGLFRRRFDNLDEGLVGECFREADRRTLRKPNYCGTFLPLLQRNIIVELDAVPDAEQKALLMAFLLTFVFEHRQAEDLIVRESGRIPKSELRHVLIVEEAHRLLSASAQSGSRGDEMVGSDSKAKAVNLFVDMLAEIRAFGQGLMIVEQIPTKIVSEAIKNTNLKIMLRLTSRDDREYLGEAMNFSESQKRFITSLKATGDEVNFVVFEEGIEQPLLLTLPLGQDRSRPLYEALFEGTTR
jgi:hypothetical protein